MSLLQEASVALSEAETAVATGRLQCLRGQVEGDLRRFRELLDGCETHGTDAGVDVALRSIMSYALLVRIIAGKATVMQTLHHQQLHNASRGVHTAVDNLGNTTMKLRIKPRESALDEHQRLAVVQEVANASSIGELEVQEEALMFITHQANSSPGSLDPILLSMKERLLAVASHETKAKTNKVPDWFTTEQDLEFVRVGSGNAIEAIHLPTGRLVEVQFPSGVSCDSIASSVALWRRIKDENVVSLVGASHVTRPSPLIVTEYCAHWSLDSFLRANESARGHLAIQLLLQAARGVSALHSTGVVHGDLRCANIGVTADQQAKVKGLTHCVDGNALRFRHYAGASPSDAGSTFARPIRWLAPECVDGAAPVSAASDVYAFGMVMFEALTGTTPYEEMSDGEVVEMKKRGDSRLPERGWSHMDRETATVIQDACHANAMLRPSMLIVMMSLRSIARSSAANAASAPTRHASTTAANIPTTLHTIPVVTAPSVVPTGTKGTATVYPLAMPPELNRSPQQASYQQQPPLTHLQPQVTVPIETQQWGQQQQQSGKVAAVLEPQQHAWVPPSVDTPPSAPARRCKLTWKTIRFIATSIMIIVGIVVGVTKSSSSSNSRKSSSPTPTPKPVKPAVGTVTTFQKDFTSNPINSIAVSKRGYVYVANYAQIFRFAEGQPNIVSPPAYAGASSNGFINGPRTTAVFRYIIGIAVDNTGALFIADADNYAIRWIPNGSNDVSTALAASANLDYPRHLAITSNDDIYIDDAPMIRFWDREKGIVSTEGSVGVIYAIAVSPNGAFFFATESLIGVLDVNGNLEEVAGSSTDSGYQDGGSTAARFNGIRGIAFSPSGDDLYIADNGNHCIRQYNVMSKLVTTLAGSCGSLGSTDGSKANARFKNPMDIAVGPSGIIYVADNEFVIRQIT